MRTGFGAVNKSLEEAKARQAQGFAGKLNYFTLKDGEAKTVRFLTDEVLTTLFYEYCVNNQGKFTDFIYAPDLYDGQGEDWVLKYGGKMHENVMNGPLITPGEKQRKERSVGVVVLREEAPREVDGKTVIGYQDYLHEITVNGENFPARWFGILKQSHQLFWNQMSGYHHEYGTICDRDYKIRRSGGGLDTSYQIIPRDPDPDFDILKLQEDYGYGRKVDPDKIKNDPERFLYCPQTLTEWAEYYAGEERAKYWLGDPKTATNEPSGLDEFHKDTTHNSQAQADEAQAAPPPSSTDWSSLRARLERHT
jgi:hypothetical protein